jgi:hypothetical protein
MAQLVNGRLGVTGVRKQVMGLIRKHPDMTYEEIGRIVGCTRQRVGQIAGVGRENPRRNRRDITVEKVTDLYNGNLWIREIAKALGCNQITVTRRLRQAGIGKSNCYRRGRILYLERTEKGNEGSGNPGVGCSFEPFSFYGKQN